MSRQERLDNFDIRSVEIQWSDVQAIERRLSEYQDDLEALMMQCRFPFENVDPTKIGSWKDTRADFQFLHIKIQRVGQSR